MKTPTPRLVPLLAAALLAAALVAAIGLVERVTARAMGGRG